MSIGKDTMIHRVFLGMYHILGRDQFVKKTDVNNLENPRNIFLLDGFLFQV